jgi:glucose/mannose transport system permease protein
VSTRQAWVPERRRAALYAVLVALVAFYLSPLFSGLMTAIKSSTAVARTAPFAPPAPDQVTFAAIEAAWETLAPTMVNSLLMVIPATILSAGLGSLAAYGLTHMEWRGQMGIVVLFVAGIFIPYQAVLVPLSQFWALVDLTPLGRWGELIELAVTHTAYGLPITTLLFRSYYQNFSDEMLEAARLDGASPAAIYYRIVLPLSVPMFAVTLIYQFTQVWNDLLFALILVNDPSAQVATLGLARLTGGMLSSFNTQMAGAFIAAFPTLLVYVLFGEKFAKGVAGET